MSYQVYRQSQLGDCLVEALDELITNEKITPPLAMKILAEFDQVRKSAPLWAACCLATQRVPRVLHLLGTALL